MIPNHPELVLDAHGLKKDWSLNNLDWASKDHVAIGLGGDVFIWDAISYTTTRLGILDGSYISSVKWVDHGAYIAAAVSSGNVQIWDVEFKPVLRTMETPEFRVPVMSWENTSVVSTGTSSGIIYNHDLRIDDHVIARLEGHRLEVCGLNWHSGGNMLASGGNDSLLNIWDTCLLRPIKQTLHKSVVKALAWCPWRPNLLATGCGMAGVYLSSRRFEGEGEGCIYLWDPTTDSPGKSVHGGPALITALNWSTTYREIVSSQSR